MKKSLSVILSLAMLLMFCGCDSQSDTPTTLPGETGATNPTVSVDFAQNDGEMFTNRDLEAVVKEENAVKVQLTGDSVSCNSNLVHISGTTVTLTQEGTYIFSGNLNDGSIHVNAEDTAKIQIVLNNAHVNSNDSAALYAVRGDKVFVTLPEGTENTLSNGGNFAVINEDTIDGAVFARPDLTFNGSGKLKVNTTAGHGIVCKDDLVLAGGSYEIEAAGHGVDANDSVRVTKANLEINAGKDGIHSENPEDTSLGFVYLSEVDLHMVSAGDGISGGAFVQMQSGKINVLCGGGVANAPVQTPNQGDMGGMGGGKPPRPRSVAVVAETTDATSMKGIKAAGNVLVNDGDITIDSADDAIHADTSVIINGGTFQIATGDDALHADVDLTIAAGEVEITQCYEGLEGQNITVSGGNIKLKATDDGLNAAGGNDASGEGGFTGDDNFGGPMGRPGGMSAGNGSVVISGGNLYIHSSGDGIDSNGSVTISGGYTVVVGPTNGDTATLDFDTEGVITGGTFIGTGASMMAQTFSRTEQGVIAVSVGNQSAQTPITLTDAQGNTVISYTPELSFQVVILSSPNIVKGETYTITVGEASGSFEAS